MSISEEIGRLKQLRAEGTLSEEEFQQAKWRAINGDDRRIADETGRLFGMTEETWCMLMHLSQLITWSGVGVAAPIVMWAISKDESALARQHGNRMMNWLISSPIYVAVSTLLATILIGIPLLIAIAALMVVFPIVAAIKCTNGEVWSYPVAIRFFDEDEIEN